MEFLVALVIIAFVILTLKWVGAWMLGVTNVLDKQDKAMTELKKTNITLSNILKELQK
tara:strand:+ start:6887 stop:7060 length:174 start_codon:yes stop_codon:yes gene_type:complete